MFNFNRHSYPPDFFIKNCSLLISFIPMALITGPFMAEILVFFSVILFLLYCFISNNYTYFKSRFVYFFLIFWLYLNINSLFSVDPILSLKTTLPYFRFLLFSLSIWFVLDKNPKFLNFFLKVLILCFIILIIDSFYQYFSVNDENLIGQTTPEPANRISSLFGDEMVLGSFMVRFMPVLAISYLFFSKKNIITIITVFAIFVIFLSGERSAISLSIMSITLSIFFIRGYGLQKFLFTTLMILFSLTIITTNKYYKQRIIDFTIKDFVFSSKVDPNQSLEIQPKFVIISDKHHSLYLTSYNMYKDKKFIGHGIKSFRALCGEPKYKYDNNSCSTHSHSIIFQLLSEIGLIGLFFYILILAYIIKRLFKINHKNKKMAKFEFFIILACIINLFPFVPSGNFFNNWLSTIYYIPVGIYLFILKNKNFINSNYK